MIRIAQKIIAAILFTVLASYAIASSPVKPIFIGVYEGTGRTCNGTLVISSKHFSWKAPYKSIKNSSYEVLEQIQNDTQLKLLLRLKKRSMNWDLSIILLERDVKNSEYAWNATAYRTLEAYRADDHDNFSCLMFKR